MPTYRKYFKNRFLLNGIELQNVSIGVSAVGKFEEPLDEAGLHLPFTIRNYEYSMRGLLQIESEDYARNKVEESYLILSDVVEEGSKYGEWKHNLRVMEYSGKYDSFLYHTFTYTKALKNNNPAPFYFYDTPFIRNNLSSSNTYDISVFLKPLFIKSTYYSNENIIIPKVDRVLQGTFVADPFRMRYGETDAFVIIDSDPSTRHEISSSDYTFTLSEGEHHIDYGFVTLATDAIPTGGADEYVYRFYINVIPRVELSLLDAINIIRDSKPFESKLYHEQTRLFNIDPEIEDYLASVEMPQMFLQKATMRQILNTLFSYVNAISRFKYDIEEKDTLTMDEYNKIIGNFDLEDVVAYSSNQEALNLFNQGIVWGERVLPTSFEEETVTSPAENLYKTVRSSQVQLTDTTFEFPLETEIYQPVQFKHLLNELRIQPDTFADNSQVFTNYELDLTPRLINREEWLLKNITVDFPSPFINKMFSSNVGFRENRVSNLYWTRGSKAISLSEVLGEVLQQNIVFSTIHEGFNEHLTRNYGAIIEPYTFYSNVASANVLVTRYNISSIPTSSPVFLTGNAYRDLRFQLKYITFESFPFQTHRENITNSPYYTEGRINQNDKAMNISFASLRAHGDTQRGGVPSITFHKIYDDYSNLLRWGMKDENDFVIVEEKFEFHNEFVKASYIATKDHNRLSLWTKVDQEYRWQEIPQSNQVFERQEIFNENVIITSPNETLQEQTTMITDTAINLMMGTLMNDWNDFDTNGKTKVTTAYVRTDGFLKVYPDNAQYKHMILTPVRSFGGRHGFSFIFGFEGNQVAGNKIGKDNVSGIETYWNTPVRYTDTNGEFTWLWFAFATRFMLDFYNNDNYTEKERLENYPLTRLHLRDDLTNLGFITHQSGPVTEYVGLHNPLMFGKKDKSQSIKVAIQTSVFPLNYKEYVLGNSFFTENFLVNNPQTEFDEVVGTPLFLYLYTSENIKYDKFSVFKVKSGYLSQTLLEKDVNVLFEEGQFRFLPPISLTNITSWAIGDEFGNLYMACNYGYNGFNISRRHFYPNQVVIGSEKIADGDIDFIFTTDIDIGSIMFVSGFEFPMIILGSDLEVNFSKDMVITKSTNYVDELYTSLGVSFNNFNVSRFEDYSFSMGDSFLLTTSFSSPVKSTNYVFDFEDDPLLSTNYDASRFTFPRKSLSDEFDINFNEFDVIQSTNLFVGSLSTSLSLSTSKTVTKYEPTKKWSYTGTSGTYDQTVTYNSGTSTCPTTSGTLSWLNTNYPPTGYATGYDMRVERLGDSVLCSPQYYYYTIVFN